MGDPVHVRYTRELSTQWDYLPTWPPNYPLALGDVVRIEDRSVARVDTLKARRIGFKARRTGKPALYEHSSGEGVTLTHKAAGQVPPVGSALASADAGVIVELQRQYAIYFRAADAVIEAIEDQDALGKEILERYADRRWELEDAVVTEVVTARDLTVLISASAAGRAELRAQAHHAAADAEVTFSAVTQRDLQTHIVSAAKLSPLYRARRVARRAKNLFQPKDENVVLRGPGDEDDVYWLAAALEERD